MPDEMTPLQFRAARVRAGFTVRGLAAELGKSAMTVHRWQVGDWPVPADIAERMRELAAGAPPSVNGRAGEVLGRLAAITEFVTHGHLPRTIPHTIQGQPAPALALMMHELHLPERAKYRCLYDDEITALMGDLAAIPERLSNGDMADYWVGYYHRKKQGRAPDLQAVEDAGLEAEPDAPDEGIDTPDAE